MAHKTVQVTNSRKVHIDLSGPSIERRPMLTTAKGRMPMACRWVEFGFDLDTGYLRWIEAVGDLVDERDIARRRASWVTGGRDTYMPVLRRRVPVNWHTHEPEYAPPWLLDYIDQYRPAGGAA